MRTALLGALMLLAALPVVRTAMNVEAAWQDYRRAGQSVTLKQREKLLLEAARDMVLDQGLSALALARPALASPGLLDQLKRHRSQAADNLAAALAGPAPEGTAAAIASVQASNAALVALHPLMDSLFSGSPPAPDLPDRWDRAGERRLADVIGLSRDLVRVALVEGHSDPAAELLLLSVLDLRQQAGSGIDILPDGRGDLESMRQRVQLLERRMEVAWDIVRDRAASLPEATSALRNAEAAWFQRFLPIQAAWLQADAGEVPSSESLRSGLSALMAIQDLAGVAIQSGLAMTERQEGEARSALAWTVVRFILAAVLATTLILLVRHRLLLPLESLTRAMAALAQGDLRTPLAMPRNTPEFADAWQALQTFKATAERLAAELDDRHRVEHQLTIERGVLEMAASQMELGPVLEALCRGVEAMVPDSRCSILLLDDDGVHMRIGAAPNLPPDYSVMLDGLAIGPEVGACGSALYRKMPVISADIASDRRWTLFRDRVLAVGLRACWSMPVLGGDGTPLGAFAVYRTYACEPAPAEMDLLHRVSHLASLVIASSRAADQLRLAKAEAEMGSRTKSEFLANMSHELRTPLNAIIGFAEVLEAELTQAANGASAAYAGDIIASGRHLLTLINDILDVSKMEAGRVELRERICGIADLLHGCERIVRARALERRLLLSVDIPEGLPPLLVDDVKFKQIILNLLSNAIKFTAPGGSVRVSATLDPARGLSVAVTDTGVGIRPEDIPQVFIPFHQVDNVYARTNPGTGLGLTLAKGMAELHGGRLTLESEFGVGTTATLHIPVSRVLWVESGGLSFPEARP
ncbi:sensor histidine kinase [Oleisolibacter albus]|uniref:sensor histidine kinase n=1 Tax=Oleisolibacter albus TaxID=2171757 RepID=UPI000DF3DC8C|nr:ATP-binding protein [Oleisolibacter albus]